MKDRPVGNLGKRAGRLLLAPLAGIGMLVAVPAATVAMTPGVSSASTSTYELLTGGVTVKTSNGDSWIMSGVWDALVSGPNLSVGIIRTSKGGDELHDWYFGNVPASSFSFSTATGKGSLNTGSSTSPLATIKLSFNKTSSAKVTCTTGSETIYTGTLTGELELVTGLTGGGTVGGRTLTFTGSTSAEKPQIKVDNECIPPLGNLCTASIAWTTGYTGTIGDGGNNLITNSGSFVGVVRYTKIAHPAGSQRDDVAEATGSTPSWNATTHVLSQSAAAGGIVTGSVTLKGGSPKQASYPCSYAGKKYTVTGIDNLSPKFTSPGGAITAHMVLGGAMAAPSSGTGFYEVATVKAA